jgi:hypothetical protein
MPKGYWIVAHRRPPDEKKGGSLSQGRQTIARGGRGSRSRDE